MTGPERISRRARWPREPDTAYGSRPRVLIPFPRHLFLRFRLFEASPWWDDLFGGLDALDADFGKNATVS